MSTQSGKTALQALKGFTPHKWFDKELKNLAYAVANYYAKRNEILGGGIATAGASITASVLQVDISSMNCMLNGYLKADYSQNDKDLFTTDHAGGVGQPIFEDGTTAAAISLGASKTAYISLIACNSKGDGDAVDGDNSALVLVAVVNGTASGTTKYDTKTDYLDTAGIQAALNASTAIHEGVTAWAHVAEILWDEGGGAPAATFILNRNNVLGA